MTPFASIALFKRANGIVFKPARKESPADKTQVRKAAMRHWRGKAVNGDSLVKVFVLQEFDGRLEISESAGRGAPWIEYSREISKAQTEPHFASAMAELGVNPDAAPPTVPDFLTINGFIYRREI